MTKLSDLKLQVRRDSPDKPEYGYADLTEQIMALRPDNYLRSSEVSLRIYPRSITIGWKFTDIMSDELTVGLHKEKPSYFLTSTVEDVLIKVEKLIDAGMAITRTFEPRIFSYDGWGDNDDFDFLDQPY